MILFRLTGIAESWIKALGCFFTVQGLMQEIEKRRSYIHNSQSREETTFTCPSTFLDFSWLFLTCKTKFFISECSKLSTETKKSV